MGIKIIALQRPTRRMQQTQICVNSAAGTQNRGSLAKAGTNNTKPRPKQAIPPLATIVFTAFMRASPPVVAQLVRDIPPAAT